MAEDPVLQTLSSFEAVRLQCLLGSEYVDAQICKIPACTSDLSPIENIFCSNEKKN